MPDARINHGTVACEADMLQTNLPHPSGLGTNFTTKNFLWGWEWGKEVGGGVLSTSVGNRTGKSLSIIASP